MSNLQIVLLLSVIASALLTATFTVLTEIRMARKGISVRHKAKKPNQLGPGKKRYQACQMFIIWDALWRPCHCHTLRSKPCKFKYKAKLQARKKIQQFSNENHRENTNFLPMVYGYHGTSKIPQ